LIENYSLVILENDIDIVSAEFCYLIIPEGDAFELIPDGVFCSVQTTESDEIQYTEYKYDVVNVVTGKLYPSSGKKENVYGFAKNRHIQSLVIC